MSEIPPWLVCIVAAAPLWFADLVVLGPKCHSATCLEPVAERVHWPTGPLECCARCAARFRRIGEVMGMRLLSEPVHYQRGGLDDTEQRFAAMELT